MRALPSMYKQTRAVAFVVAPAAILATLLVGFTSQGEWLFWAGVGLIVGNAGLIGIYALARATRRPLGGLLRFGFWVLWIGVGVGLVARSEPWTMISCSVPRYFESRGGSVKICPRMVRPASYERALLITDQAKRLRRPWDSLCPVSF
jgi:hypothetical protein